MSNDLNFGAWVIILLGLWALGSGIDQQRKDNIENAKWDIKVERMVR